MKTTKLFGTVLAIVTLVFGSISLYASEDYKSIIRYDRVWESVTGEWGPYTVKYMKFDGTEEINGLTYHRIVTYKKSIVKRDSNGNEQYEYLDDVYENEGYLREEDGKVYTLILCSNKNGCFEGVIYPSSDISNLEQYELSEQLVYDFNVEVGSCFSGFSAVMRFGEPTVFKVKSKSKVIVDGEECIKMSVWYADSDFETGGAYEIIEGVGPIEYGCLNYNEFLDRPTRAWAYNYLNRLFDDNGNVLYESGAKDYKIPNGAFSMVSTLNESPSIFMSNGQISFGEDNHSNSVKIYDLNGRLVKSASIMGRVTLSTMDLIPGVYVCVAETDGKPISRRKFSVK